MIGSSSFMLVQHYGTSSFHHQAYKYHCGRATTTILKEIKVRSYSIFFQTTASQELVIGASSFELGQHDNMSIDW